MGAVGIAAPLAVAGQGIEKGRWDAVAKYLPGAVEMAPGLLRMRLDGRGPAQRAQSLLAIVANTPRAGAGLLMVPAARVDDGLFDVRAYEEMGQPALARRYWAGVYLHGLFLDGERKSIEPHRALSRSQRGSRRE